MTDTSLWRGTRRIRVALDVTAQGWTLRSLQWLTTPAVQRAQLEGDWVAAVRLDQHLVIAQAFADPLLKRGASRPDEPGHVYLPVAQATIHVDLPVGPEDLIGAPSLQLWDLSRTAARPRDHASVAKQLAHPPEHARLHGQLDAAALMAHPDWPGLGLSVAGTPADPNTQTLPDGRFEIYLDKSRKWRWRLRRSDGAIVADSGQGYARRVECEADLLWIRLHADKAAVHSLDLG